MLVDVRSRYALSWHASLEPEGDGGFDKEPFEAQWARNRERLSCRLERWPVERILGEVAWGWTDSDEHPEFNSGVFHGKPFEPGLTMDASGTWNIPPVILEAPGGLLTDHGPRPDARHWLIEGHPRRRYLHALACRREGAGKPGTSHEVLVLSLRTGPDESG